MKCQTSGLEGSKVIYLKELQQRFATLGSLEKLNVLKSLLSWAADDMEPSLRLQLLLKLLKVSIESLKANFE